MSNKINLKKARILQLKVINEEILAKKELIK